MEYMEECFSLLRKFCLITNGIFVDSGKKNGEHQPRMQGDHERETESQQQRVSHPPEAGRRIKEPGEKQKVNNKASVTPGRKIQERRGKQKVNNKESGSPESRKEDQGNHVKMVRQ
jgi:hypothetical protein